jgi:hypothetical protein
VAIPVLFLAFNRPELTRNLLQQLDKHSVRKVFISVDGPPEKQSNRLESWIETNDLINNWATSTKHYVKTRVLPSNLGCNAHTLNALRWFLNVSGETCGFLLEDDVEFQNDYLRFLDSINLYSVHKDFLGICPSNSIWVKDLAYKDSDEQITWLRTSVLSQTWGMTFSSRTLEVVENFIARMQNNQQNIELMIENWARMRICGNFALRIKFMEYWQGKFLRVLETWDKSKIGYSKTTEVGWDAVLQLAAAEMEEDFLVPNWNIARTSLDAHVGAWHRWQPPYPKWDSLDKKLTIQSDMDAVKNISYRLTLLRFSNRRFPVKALLRYALRGHSKNRPQTLC